MLEARALELPDRVTDQVKAEFAGGCSAFVLNFVFDILLRDGSAAQRARLPSPVTAPGQNAHMAWQDSLLDQGSRTHSKFVFYLCERHVRPALVLRSTSIRCAGPLYVNRRGARLLLQQPLCLKPLPDWLEPSLQLILLVG